MLELALVGVALAQELEIGEGPWGPAPVPEVEATAPLRVTPQARRFRRFHTMSVVGVPVFALGGALVTAGTVELLAFNDLDGRATPMIVGGVLLATAGTGTMSWASLRALDEVYPDGAPTWTSLPGRLGLYALAGAGAFFVVEAAGLLAQILFFDETLAAVNAVVLGVGVAGGIPATLQVVVTGRHGWEAGLMAMPMALRDGGGVRVALAL